MSKFSDVWKIDSEGVRTLVQLALREDAPAGDISAELSVPEEHQSVALVIAREKLVYCGAQFLPVLFGEFGRGLAWRGVAADGQVCGDGTPLVELSGSTRAILQIERPLLNFLQRLCGVASRAAELVALAGSVTVLDTRKTMPGWRALDKYATRTGGAKNHRFSLSDMILIKNNHIDARGGDIEATLKSVFAGKPRDINVQVEVRNMEELKKAISFSPTSVLLDNMNDTMIAECLSYLGSSAPGVLIEVSGGITPQRFQAFARMGVPSVSLGSLTTAAPNRDISLRIKNAGGELS